MHLLLSNLDDAQHACQRSVCYTKRALEGRISDLTAFDASHCYQLSQQQINPCG
jgi:hypothetical protein